MADEYPTLDSLGTDAFGSTAQDSAPPNPFLLAKRLLRGRVRWAILVGLLLAAVGPYVLYRSSVPVYRSRGLIEVIPKVPKLLYESDESNVPPMFDGYMQSQERLASSRRVIDMAMRSETWRSAGGGHSDGEIIGFQYALFVRRDARSQYIEIAFTHSDPNLAKAAVDAVMDAYLTLVAENDQEGDVKRIAALEEKQRGLKAGLAELESHELTASEDYGAEAVAARYGGLTGEIAGLDALISALDVDIQTIEASRGATNSDDPGRELSMAEMAAFDPEIARLERARESAQQQLDAAVTAGLGSAHPTRAAAAKLVADEERRLAERIISFKALRAASPVDVDPQLVLLREKETRRVGLIELRTEKQDELKKLAIKQSRLRVLATQRDGINSELRRVDDRIEQLITEGANRGGGRIRKAAEAERPVAPEKDRRLQLAIAAACAGMFAGFVLVALYGLLNSRMRHIDDMQSHEQQGRFLGILPELPPDSEQSQVEMGDYCVHHVRTMLQLRARGRRNVIALTSAVPGAGKTTIGLAIGASFGATGARTLMIDCDFVGRGISSALRSLAFDTLERALHDRPSAHPPAPTNAAVASRAGVARLIAARSRVVTVESVDQLLHEVRSAALGGERELAKAVSVLETMCRFRDRGVDVNGSCRGVLDALEGRDLEDCIVETTLPGVSVLPAGDASGSDASRLSPELLASMLDRCRERYDTIIIDTGPVLGSLEASFVAASADQVLCIVTRGEKRAVVDEAMHRLERIGVDLAGLVFNRATSSDVVRSSYKSASASVPVGTA